VSPREKKKSVLTKENFERMEKKWQDISLILSKCEQEKNKVKAHLDLVLASINTDSDANKLNSEVAY